MSKQNRSQQWILWAALAVLAPIHAGCSADAEPATAAEAGQTSQPGVLELESFLTNINDPSGERYCKLTIKLAIVPSDKVDGIKEDPLLLARIRDQVLTMLSGKTLHELSDPKGKEAFREDVRTGLAALLEGIEIQQVLFSEFVVQ
jgi:flagellar FliL protein